MDQYAANNGIAYEDVIFDSSFPFYLGYSRLIYTEPYYDENINRYIIKHYDEINKDRSRLLYFPIEAQGVTPILQYNRPGFDFSFIDSYKVKPESIQALYNKLFNHRKGRKRKPWIPDTPLLIRMDNRNLRDEYNCILYPIHYESDEQFEKLLNAIILEPESEFDNKIYQSTREERLGREKEDPRDRADKESISIIADEIRERISKLQLMGVSDFVIRNLIQVPEAKISPLLITSDYRIILPAYDDMEIEMPTLSKVVFFFYLRHPEGLRFKELIDYRKELLDIYYSISNRENLDKLEQSIDELVDSTRNSINEKCSRIRAAFVSQFADELAHNYYITGNYATPKRIKLDRNMLIDQSGLLIK